MSAGQIYCIGDSHVSVFIGKDALAPVFPERGESIFPIFNVNRIGPITAFNIGNPTSSTQAKTKIDAIILGEISKGSTIVFCAGEIDIRVHVLKQAHLQKKNADEICAQIIEKYISQLSEYASWGYKIIVVSATPASYLTHDDPEYPKFGTEKERNIATRIFNDQLKTQAQKHGFAYVNVFNKYVDSGNVTNKECLWDGVHASSIVLKDIVFQLNNILDMQLRFPFRWHVKQYLKKIKRTYERILKKSVA